MHRSLSAVVLVSVGTLLPGAALAQRPPDAPEGAAARSATDSLPDAGPAAPKAEPAPPKRSEERLSDEAELARVVGLYEAGKYDQCSDRIERLLDPTSRTPLRQPTIVENARVYWAACLMGQGKVEQADAPLRAAIHENPQMKAPDSLVFPAPVVQRFLKVRDSLMSEIRAAEQARIKQAQTEARQRELVLQRERDRMRVLEKLATQESVVVRNRRVLSFVPFGVGQIQNRQEALGYTLMVSEAALAGLSISAVIVQSRIAAEADEQRRQGLAVNPSEINQLQATWGTVRTASFWAFAGVAVMGVLQAQLEYVPEFRELRQRPLPPERLPSEKSGARKGRDVAWLPYFDHEGGGLNVVGRF